MTGLVLMCIHEMSTSLSLKDYMRVKREERKVLRIKVQYRKGFINRDIVVGDFVV